MIESARVPRRQIDPAQLAGELRAAGFKGVGFLDDGDPAEISVLLSPVSDSRAPEIAAIVAAHVPAPSPPPPPPIRRVLRALARLARGKALSAADTEALNSAETAQG